MEIMELVPILIIFITRQCITQNVGVWLPSTQNLWCIISNGYGKYINTNQNMTCVNDTGYIYYGYMQKWHTEYFPKALWFICIYGIQTNISQWYGCIYIYGIYANNPYIYICMADIVTSHRAIVSLYIWQTD